MGNLSKGWDIPGHMCTYSTCICGLKHTITHTQNLMDIDWSVRDAPFHHQATLSFAYKDFGCWAITDTPTHTHCLHDAPHSRGLCSYQRSSPPSLGHSCTYNKTLVAIKR